MATTVKHGWLLVLLPIAASAGDIADPTRPAGPAAPMPAQVAERTSSADSSPPRTLQMIVRGPGEQRTALIDGVAARIGDTLGGARVLRITDDSVLLANGAERITLELPAARDAVRAASKHSTPRAAGSQP